MFSSDGCDYLAGVSVPGPELLPVTTQDGFKDIKTGKKATKKKLKPHKNLNENNKLWKPEMEYFKPILSKMIIFFI